ncbi:amidase domain-containing protein [Clostridium sp. A1-XYC3]|uniref:Amidase domain-containing protein n=2 Tax=Clostridium tanneri TaxID=3037988 RepID=A0ABU4JRW9_9CLOT|nr:amidase domain-containing protein [Clostridium sp. A1-XYC3]
MHYNLYHKKKFTIYLFITLLISMSLSNFNSNTVVYASQNCLITKESYDENELKTVVEDIYNKRSSAFVTGDLLSLKGLFDTSEKYGQWALEHEVKRVKYLHTWCKERGIKLAKVQSDVRINKIPSKDRRLTISLEESYKFDYIYPADETPITNSFGVGIKHTLSLTKKNNKWLVYNDCYTDCFEDALQAYSGDIAENLIPSDGLHATYKPTLVSMLLSCRNAQSNKRFFYNRRQAVQYADKYCGAAWGSGNDFKYNKKYKDFNGIGGDCTNYASQVLGDKEAGALPMDSAWHCEYSKAGNNQGTVAWVNADGLKDYLRYSGTGSVIGKGTFSELTASTLQFANGIVQRLQLADLVCYEKKGTTDHFAVITGWDSHGYPLVNSHTTDRYHVPWDLGWGDNRIRFFLIHING